MGNSIWSWRLLQIQPVARQQLNDSLSLWWMLPTLSHSHSQKCVWAHHSPPSSTPSMSLRSPFVLLSIRGEGSQLSGVVGWARGESSETWRLAKMKYLKKPSRACFTQLLPSGSVPSGTNNNYCGAMDERLDQRTEAQSAHTWTHMYFQNDQWKHMNMQHIQQPHTPAN